jgi:hypothetical protein
MFYNMATMARTRRNFIKINEIFLKHKHFPVR